MRTDMADLAIVYCLPDEFANDYIKMPIVELPFEILWSSR